MKPDWQDMYPSGPEGGPQYRYETINGVQYLVLRNHEDIMKEQRLFEVEAAWNTRE